MTEQWFDREEREAIETRREEARERERRFLPPVTTPVPVEEVNRMFLEATGGENVR